jgi:hypothetical protein
MKTSISFVLVAFLVLLGSAKSDFDSAVQPNRNPTPAHKPTQVLMDQERNAKDNNRNSEDL